MAFDPCPDDANELDRIPDLFADWHGVESDMGAAAAGGTQRCGRRSPATNPLVASAGNAALLTSAHRHLGHLPPVPGGAEPKRAVPVAARPYPAALPEDTDHRV